MLNKPFKLRDSNGNMKSFWLKEVQLDDVLAKNFPEMESAEEIRSHIWQDHPVWSRLNKLEEDVALLKSNIPPSS